MDLAPTPEQAAYRLKVRQWLEANLPEGWGSPYLSLSDSRANVRLQREWERKLFEAGYRGVALPREYGGHGLTLVEHLIVSEELGRIAAPEGIDVVGIELVIPILLDSGTEGQKRRFIRKILAAEESWCQGFSEPGAGSDLASVRTAARAEGDEWVINGQKVWTSYAVEADWCILLARTDPSAPKHKGLTLFMVPMNTPGVDVRPLPQITGRQEFNEVFFDNVRIAADHVIGPVNEGWQVSSRVLGYERGTTRFYRQARYEHEIAHLVDIATARAKERGGEVPADMRQRLAEAFCDLWIHRRNNHKLVARMLAGERIGPEVSINKLFWSEAHQRLAGLGLDILAEGALAEEEGALSEGRFQYLYLSTRAETIYAGSSQIQRNIIAERMLGMPR